MTSKSIGRVVLVFGWIFSFLITASCGYERTPQVSASGAEQSAPPKIRKNSRGHTAEQQNIYDRIDVTTDPTKVMWIHLIALDGKIIRRMPVTSKVTSSGKRLEAKHWVGHNEFNHPPVSGGFSTDEIIQPDGTFGESDPYIYWFDPQHRYHQYGTAGGLGYLKTDYPIDLVNPMDEVTGMYNANLKAMEWQKKQEEKLKEQEAKHTGKGQ